MSAGHQESETVSAAEESRAGEASADQRRPEFKEQLLQRADRLLQSVHQDLHGQPGQQGQVSDLHCLLVVTAVMSCTAAGDKWASDVTWCAFVSANLSTTSETYRTQTSSVNGLQTWPENVTSCILSLRRRAYSSRLICVKTKNRSQSLTLVLGLLVFGF